MRHATPKQYNRMERAKLSTKARTRDSIQRRENALALILVCFTLLASAALIG